MASKRHGLNVTLRLWGDVTEGRSVRFGNWAPHIPSG